jgi:hypothetical protein
MTTLVDMLVQGGVLRSAAEKYVALVLFVTPSYKLSSFRFAFPLHMKERMNVLAEEIDNMKDELNQEFTQEVQEMVRSLLLTGVSRPSSHAPFKRVQTDIKCVVSTNPYCV